MGLWTTIVLALLIALVSGALNGEAAALLFATLSFWLGLEAETFLHVKWRRAGMTQCDMVSGRDQTEAALKFLARWGALAPAPVPGIAASAGDNADVFGLFVDREAK